MKFLINSLKQLGVFNENEPKPPKQGVEVFCSICQEEEEIFDEKWVKLPCDCKGPMSFMHEKCLINYIGFSETDVCPNCKKNYKSYYNGLKFDKLIKFKFNPLIAIFFPICAMIFFLIFMSQLLILFLNFTPLSLISIFTLSIEFIFLLYLFEIPIRYFNVYIKLYQTNSNIEIMKSDKYFNQTIDNLRTFIKVICNFLQTNFNLTEGLNDPWGFLLMFFSNISLVESLIFKFSNFIKNKNIISFLIYGYLFWIEKKICFSFLTNENVIKNFMDGFIYANHIYYEDICEHICGDICEE